MPLSGTSYKNFRLNIRLNVWKPDPNIIIKAGCSRISGWFLLAMLYFLCSRHSCLGYTLLQVDLKANGVIWRSWTVSDQDREIMQGVKRTDGEMYIQYLIVMLNILRFNSMLYCLALPGDPRL